MCLKFSTFLCNFPHLLLSEPDGKILRESVPENGVGSGGRLSCEAGAGIGLWGDLHPQAGGP